MIIETTNLQPVLQKPQLLLATRPISPQTPSLPSHPSLPSPSHPSLPILSNLSHNDSLNTPNDIVKNSKNTIYINNDEIKKEIKQSKFSILSFNIRSLTKNIMTLKDTVKTLDTDIIGLQEIWNPHAGFVKIDGYKDIIMKKRSGKRGGGLGFYLRNDMAYKTLDDVNNLNLKKIEALGIKLTTDNNETQIINIYRPPGSDKK